MLIYVFYDNKMVECLKLCEYIIDSNWQCYEYYNQNKEKINLLCNDDRIIKSACSNKDFLILQWLLEIEPKLLTILNAKELIIQIISTEHICECKKFQLFTILLNANPSIKSILEDIDIFENACLHGQFKIIKEIVKLCPDTHKFITTQIVFANACMSNNIYLVKWIYKYWPKQMLSTYIDLFNYAFIYSCHKGADKTVKLLIEWIDYKDYLSNAFIYSCVSNNIKLFQFIEQCIDNFNSDFSYIDENSDLNQKIKKNWNAALYELIQSKCNFLLMLKYIITKCNITNHVKNYAVTTALKTGQIEIVDFINTLNWKVTIDTTISDLDIVYICKNSTLDGIKIFIEAFKEANFDKQFYDKIFYYACHNSNVEVLIYADKLAENKCLYKITKTLYEICIFGNGAHLNYLLQQYPDNLTYFIILSAMLKAIENHNLEVIKILWDNIDDVNRNKLMLNGLVHACKSSELSAQFILHLMPDLNYTNENNLLFHLANTHKKYGIIYMLF